MTITFTPWDEKLKIELEKTQLEEFRKHVEKRAELREEVERFRNMMSTPTAKQSTMRCFVLERSIDTTGTSGTGVVAEGVEFSNGQVVIHWISQLESVNVYANVRVLESLHGHGGNTVIRWLGE